MTPPVDARRKLVQRIDRGLRAARLVLGSLRVKAGLAIVAAFAAGFTLLAAIVMYSAEQETRQLIGNQQTVIALNVANDIDEKIAMARDMLLDTARRLPLARLHDAAEMETFIRSNGAMFGLFDDIVIRLPDGRVVADWPMAPGRRGSDRLNAEHFKVAMATGKPHISKPFAAPLLKTPVIVMSVPVLDSAGRPVTVLSGLIHLLRPNFLGRLATRRIGDSGHFVLTDGDGTIMVHPRSDRIMTHASSDGSGAAIERARNESQGHYEGREAKLYAASIVKSTGWALLAVLPQDEAYRPLVPMRARLAIIFVALLAALGVLVWLLMGRLLAPLTALKAAVQAYGAGADRAAPLDLDRVQRGNAEIDEVADAFRRTVERTEATAARLREERAFSAAVVEHAGTLVLVLDREGRFVRFNRACEELSGYSFAEVEGKFPWDTVLPPEDANTVKEQAFESLARNPQALSGRYVNDWLTKARERRLIDWHNTLLLDAGGAMQFMVSVGIDITERRRAEQVERDSRHRLQSILDSIFARVGLFTLEGVVLEANRALVEVAGQKREDVIGKPLWDAYWWSHSPVAQEQVREALRRAAQGETVRDDFRVRLAENVFITIDATFGPVRDEKGRVTQLVGSSVDITERKRAEARVRAALAEKDVLLQEIYHRVKNNLQVVSSLLNMQGRAIADPAMKELFAESASRVKSMALVHEQLYRSQDLSNISLAEYFKQLAEHLQYAHRPLSTRVPLRLEVADLRLGIETAVPLGLIVNELVSNAYKHGYGADTVRGEIELRAASLDDGRVRLEVADDGRGLPGNFEPKSVTSLGMQLVVTLAAQLAGELRHRSEDGRTSFEILFRPEAREADRLVA